MTCLPVALRLHRVGDLSHDGLDETELSGLRGEAVLLQAYSAIKLSADAIARADDGDGWDEALIEERTHSLIDDILAIWPVPAGHTNEGRHVSGGSSAGEVTIQDLLKAGLLTAGQILVSGNTKYPDVQATVTAEGLLEFEGKFFDYPSDAGKAATKRRAVNGWWFWRVGSTDGPRLRELRQQLTPGQPDEPDEDS